MFQFFGNSKCIIAIAAGLKQKMGKIIIKDSSPEPSQEVGTIEIHPVPVGVKLSPQKSSKKTGEG